jgi:hypothetical protein
VKCYWLTPVTGGPCVGTVGQQPGVAIAASIATIAAKLTADVNSSNASTAASARAAQAAMAGYMGGLVAEYGIPSEAGSSTGAVTPGGNPLGKASGMTTTGTSASPGDSVYNVWNYNYTTNISNTNIDQTMAPVEDTAQDLGWIDVLVSKFRQLFGLDTPMDDVTETGVNPNENETVLPESEIAQKKTDEGEVTTGILDRLWDAVGGLRNRITAKIEQALPSGTGVCSLSTSVWGHDFTISFCDLDLSVWRNCIICLGVISACLILIA